MLQNESILQVADNSGAKKILIIRCLGGSNRKFSRIGDVVVATVKKADPHANIKKGQVVLALIVATKKHFRRQNNTWIKFSKNCAVLIKKENREPVGTRLFIPLLAEFDLWGHKKLFSLAPEIV
jgi:large subunit ribosomal protein L14